MKRLLVFFLCLIFSTWAFAAVEYRGEVILAGDLFEGPGAENDTNGLKVKAGQDVYIMGTAMGGTWVHVVLPQEGSGWIPAGRLKIEKVLPTEAYQIQERVNREKRVKSVLQMDLGLSSGSMPFGKGVALFLTGNMSPSGLLSVNGDQFEVGGFVSYYLGAEVFGFIENDDERYSLSGDAKKFVAYGLFGQWLFRSGETGSFQFGPRGGFMAANYSINGLDRYPLLLGLVMRLYTDERFGWHWSATIGLESAITFTYDFGISLRY